MVVLDTKQVKLVWAPKPRPDSGHSDADARRRVYTPGMAIPRPLVRRPSLDNKTRHTTVVIRRETPTVTDKSSADRSSSVRPTMTSVTPVKMDAAKTQRKPLTTPSATKVTELKPILKTGKSSYDSKPDDSRIRDALSAGLDNKFSYRLPDKPTVPKTKKSVHFKDADISSSKVIAPRRQYSPIYTVQYTGSVYKPEMIERRQIYV